MINSIQDLKAWLEGSQRQLILRALDTRNANSLFVYSLDSPIDKQRLEYKAAEKAYATSIDL